jgi:hypothetical protein
VAGEIVIPMILWPHRTVNANATWDQITAVNNVHQAAGWRMRDGEAAELNFRLACAIPANINATPAAAFHIRWLSSAATGSVHFYIHGLLVTYDTTSTDPASITPSHNVGDPTNGAYIENACSIPLSGITVTAGKGLRGYVYRDATSGNTEDTLAADVILTEMFLVADQA